MPTWEVDRSAYRSELPNADLFSRADLAALIKIYFDQRNVLCVSIKRAQVVHEKTVKDSKARSSRLIYIINHNKRYINSHPKHVDSKLLINTFSLTTLTHEYHIFKPQLYHGFQFVNKRDRTVRI